MPERKMDQPLDCHRSRVSEWTIKAYIAYILRLRCGFRGGEVALRWVFLGATYFFRNRYDSGMDIKNRELWDRLENEPERAYRAFESFLALPSGERTLLEAYRGHVGNPEAAKPSDTWAKWSSAYAWRERAAAYDDHLASLRREAHERVIEEEAERQAREVERTRGRLNELMTMAYHRAMECLEDEDWVRSNLRSSDVIQIMKLNVDYLKAFDIEPESREEDDWVEEDDPAIDEIIKEIDAQPYLEHPDLGLEDEEGSEEGSDEDHSDESEGEEP